MTGSGSSSWWARTVSNRRHPPCKSGRSRRHVRPGHHDCSGGLGGTAHLDCGQPSLTVVDRTMWHGCGTRPSESVAIAVSAGAGHRLPRGPKERHRAGAVVGVAVPGCCTSALSMVHGAAQDYQERKQETQAAQEGVPHEGDQQQHRKCPPNPTTCPAKPALRALDLHCHPLPARYSVITERLCGLSRLRPSDRTAGAQDPYSAHRSPQLPSGGVGTREPARARTRT